MIAHPPELAALLVALGQAGVELAAHPSNPARLRYRPIAIPRDRLERLRKYRDTVLGLLVGDRASSHGCDGYVFGERLGMADGLGMPIHPGSAAWLVAVGESMTTEYRVAMSQRLW